MSRKIAFLVLALVLLFAVALPALTPTISGAHATSDAPALAKVYGTDALMHVADPDCPVPVVAGCGGG